MEILSLVKGAYPAGHVSAHSGVKIQQSHAKSALLPESQPATKQCFPAISCKYAQLKVPQILG